MSQIRKFIGKAGLLAIIAWGGYNWANQSPEHKDAISAKTVSILQTSEERTNAAREKTLAYVGQTKAAAVNALEPLNINGRVDALQERTKPLRRSLRAHAKPVTGPVAKAVKDVDKKIPLIGIIFIIIVGLMITVMAASMFNDNDYA